MTPIFLIKMEWKQLVASVLHGHFFPSPFLSANIFKILFYSLAVRFVCKFSQVCPLYWFGQKTSVKGPNTNCQESHRKKRDSSVGNSRCHGAAFTQMKYRTHRFAKYWSRIASLKIPYWFVIPLILLTLVALGCRNYIKPWGGGQICHTIEIFSNMVENPFFQSLP